jgi:bifunctional non-homologous end joining protein LigD
LPTRTKQGRAAALRSGKGVKLSGACPGFIKPCHPVQRDRPPSGADWVHEIKADGYRAQVHLRGGKATVYSRRGYDWTETFASIARAAETLPL